MRFPRLLFPALGALLATACDRSTEYGTVTVTTTDTAVAVVGFDEVGPPGRAVAYVAPAPETGEAVIRLQPVYSSPQLYRRMEAVVREEAAATEAEPHGPWASAPLPDLDGDGTGEVAMLFTLEAPLRSADLSSVHLSLLRSRGGWRALTVAAGARYARTPMDLRVSGDTIILKMKVWREGDPGCCPTGDGESRYRLKEGVLVQILEVPTEPRWMGKGRKLILERDPG